MERPGTFEHTMGYPGNHVTTAWREKYGSVGKSIPKISKNQLHVKGADS